MTQCDDMSVGYTAVAQCGDMSLEYTEVAQCGDMLLRRQRWYNVVTCHWGDSGDTM